MHIEYYGRYSDYVHGEACFPPHKYRCDIRVKAYLHKGYVVKGDIKLLFYQYAAAEVTYGAENIENDHWVHAERRKDENKHQMDECAAHLEYGVFYFICDLHIRLEQLGREKFILGNVHERDPFLNAGFGSEPKHLRVTVCSNIIFGKIKKCSRHKSTKSSAYIIGR